MVVGGTTGIGHALSLGLADAGADVVASSRRAEEVEKTAIDIEQRGRKTIRCTSDVKDRASLTAMRDAVLAAFGKVDILINCAGTTKRAPTLTFTEDDWAHIIETNLTGTLRGCQIFGESMLARRLWPHHQHRFAIDFRCALRGSRIRPPVRAAVGSLTKSLAVEWSKHGVLVNAIAPGVFRTALNSNLLDNSERGREFLTRTPMGRFGKTEELVESSDLPRFRCSLFCYRARLLLWMADFSPAVSISSYGISK